MPPNAANSVHETIARRRNGYLHAAMRAQSSRIDLDRSADVHCTPYDIHIVVAQSYTSICPVEQLGDKGEPAEPVPLSVNHDEAARIDTARPSRCNVRGVWIRDVNGLVVPAVGVLRIEHIATLWRALVAL